MRFPTTGICTLAVALTGAGIAHAQDATTFAGTVRAAEMTGLSYQSGGCIVAVSDRARREGLARAGEVLVELDRARTDLALRTAQARVLDLEAAMAERQLAVDAARADVDRRAQELAFTQREFERNTTLFRRGLINESAMETVERRQLDASFAADRAAEALASAQSALSRAGIARDIGLLDLQNAQLDSEKLTVVAPFDGALVGFDPNVGSCVAQNAEAAQIYAPGDKAVDIYVLISQLAAARASGVAIGAAAEIGRVNGQICDGTVTRIDSEANLETQYVRAEIAVAPACAPNLFLNEAVEVRVTPLNSDS